SRIRRGRSAEPPPRSPRRERYNVTSAIFADQRSRRKTLKYRPVFGGATHAVMLGMRFGYTLLKHARSDAISAPPAPEAPLASALRRSRRGPLRRGRCSTARLVRSTNFGGSKCNRPSSAG